MSTKRPIHTNQPIMVETNKKLAKRERGEKFRDVNVPGWRKTTFRCRLPNPRNQADISRLAILGIAA